MNRADSGSFYMADESFRAAMFQYIESLSRPAAWLQMRFMCSHQVRMLPRDASGMAAAKLCRTIEEWSHEKLLL